MKKQLISATCLTALCALSACMPEGADIGDLYGRWHLEEVTAPTPVGYSDTLYLSFQGQVYQYQPNWEYDWGTYRQTSDSLILNPVQWERFYFHEMGLTCIKTGSRTPAAFKLSLLTNKQMILERNDTVWSFHKYIE